MYSTAVEFEIWCSMLCSWTGLFESMWNMFGWVFLEAGAGCCFRTFYLLRVRYWIIIYLQKRFVSWKSCREDLCLVPLSGWFCDFSCCGWRKEISDSQMTESRAVSVANFVIEANQLKFIPTWLVGKFGEMDEFVREGLCILCEIWLYHG